MLRSQALSRHWECGGLEVLQRSFPGNRLWGSGERAAGLLGSALRPVSFGGRGRSRSGQRGKLSWMPSQSRSQPASQRSGAGRALPGGPGLGLYTPMSTVIGCSCSRKRARLWTSFLSLAKGKSWRGTQLRADHGLRDVTCSEVTCSEVTC